MKKLKFDPVQFKTGLLVFFIVAAILILQQIITNIPVIYASFSKVFSSITKVFLPFIIGVAIAYLLDPMVRFFERKIGGEKVVLDEKTPKKVRYLSLAIVYLIFLGTLAVVFSFIIPQVIGSINTVYAQAIAAYDNYSGLIMELVAQYGVEDILVEYGFFDWLNINSIIKYSMQYVQDFYIAMYNIILGLLISAYFQAEKYKFKRHIDKLMFIFLSKQRYIWIKRVSAEANRIFINFFSGKLLDSLIIGAICFVGLIILNNPYPVLISIIIGVTNMIPYFGPFIGAVPAIFFTLLVSPVAALWVLIFILALQQFDGIVLGPRILGDFTGLAPIWVLFSVIIGGATFGVLGMLLGVPVFAVIYRLSHDYFSRKYYEKVHKDNLGIRY